ncbi:MAG: hypothetical protein ABI954_04175 [Pyrinomonadaceae bacterium]
MKIFVHFLIFVLLLLVLFVSAISAQTPKITWKNIQEKYESLEDVKPIISNKGTKYFYLYPNLDLELMIFDEVS